ncbi:MAG: YchF/TatD family DNA exonuclease [Armatimonadetes bacterium]|nr:YchF/TatD family DNA exonuclease [Armatimonadota bacterium]NIM23476.1 YchF/TatD family DNA exonuclease [Armatimonadota bacterium]NIM67342.1 YchF/TatD family DNA exonuclease [Armatimonadota bacterium]NIM75843.1 YchF/TatD family DNA exonuclease [Armatimonadota bacterium]NIN05528.1 YchF/TatD family DNA exonuclease [Armatimonadota bacterium]
MIDSHVHLNHPRLETDLEAVLSRASSAGIEMMLVPGYDLPSSRQAVALAERYPQILAAVGVHPHDAATLDEKALAELRELAARPRVVAIGEIGLDFHRDLSPRQVQTEAFALQIRLAREARLPIIIHQREADRPSRELFQGESAGELGGVWHCFSGDEELADFALAEGFCIGIAGPVTFQNARGLAALAARLPAESLLIETDAPYLSPHPHRGQRNEPARLPLIAESLAALRGGPVDATVRATTANFRRLFLQSRAT